MSVQGTWREAPADVRTLPFTGERIVPGKTEESLFRQHEARYVFAGKFVKDKVVLDVACGTGIGTHYLLRAGAESSLGLDIDGAAVAYAKAAYECCQFAQCDATNLPVSDGCIDVVVSFETIEHLGDQRKFLLECIRVLKPGGVFICSTPNHTVSSWGNKNPYHLHEFTVTEFTCLLESVFDNVQLFAQQKTNLLLYVCRVLLLHVLGEVQLKNAVKKLLRRKPAPLALQAEFGGMGSNWDSEIQPYHTAALMKPMFFVAVARRGTGIHRG